MKESQPWNLSTLTQTLDISVLLHPPLACVTYPAELDLPYLSLLDQLAEFVKISVPTRNRKQSKYYWLANRVLD